MTFSFQKQKLASLLCLGVFFIAMCGCYVRRYVFLKGMDRAETDGTISGVDYGYDAKDKLHFVVFKTDQSTSGRVFHAAWISVGSNNVCEAITMKLSSGENLDLLSTSPYQVYSIENGSIAVAPINFSKSDLEKYIKQEKVHYSVENLRQFLNRN